MHFKTTTLVAAFALLLALPGSALAAPKAKLRFATPVVVASEASGSATITVTRQPRNGKSKSTFNSAVTVNYATSAGTAGPADYTNVSGTLSFAAGEISKTFVVPITDDGDLEGVETVNLRLSAPSRQAVLVNPASATLNIADDDGPVQIQFSSPTYSVSEFGPTADVTVIRTGQLGATVSSVAYATADGSAGNADYDAQNGTLNFGVGEIDKTISVDVKQDAAIEGAETFSVGLSAPTNAVLAGANPATVTIVDDDTVSGKPELAFEAASYSGAENGGGIAVTVVRNGPVNSIVSASIKSIAGSATADVDFSSLDDTVDFEDGDLTQTLFLPLLDDSADEADETLALQLSDPVDGALASPSTTDLTILDDDTAVVVDNPQQPTPEAPAPVVNVTNNTTTVNNTTFVNPLATQAGILLLGERIGSCRLNIGTFKAQRILRSKAVRVKLHAVEACTGNVKSHVKGRKSLRGVKKGAVQTKVVKFSLKAGQSKTIKMRFTKRGLKFLRRALGKQRTLSAALLVRSTNAAKRVTLNTLRWKAKR
jgi:hypothetical protein